MACTTKRDAMLERLDRAPREDGKAPGKRDRDRHQPSGQSEPQAERAAMEDESQDERNGKSHAPMGHDIGNERKAHASGSPQGAGGDNLDAAAAPQRRGHPQAPTRAGENQA